MTSKNDITGDSISTKGITTDAYRDSWERVFGKKKVVYEPGTQSEDCDCAGFCISEHSDTPCRDDHGILNESK